jgi:hypothetical protein
MWRLKIIHLNHGEVVNLIYWTTASSNLAKGFTLNYLNVELTKSESELEAGKLYSIK